MKTISATVFFTVFVIIFSLSHMGDAYAKRFGGGRSFGSKPSYSNPFKRSSSTKSRSAGQQKAAARNQAARNSLSRRGGLMGMLGGLALGGLLGALFFGGAFENLNMFDILIFGAIAYVLYRLFASGQKRTSAYSPGSRTYSGNPDPHYSGDPFERSDPNTSQRNFDTDLLFKKGQQDSSDPRNRSQTDADFIDDPIPDNFNRDDFLHGAKIAYKQLQAAWDTGELTEIRGLTSDHVFIEIKDQINSRKGNSHTDIIKLDAELLNVQELASKTEASVLFDAILKESTDQRPAQVREIWHFIRPVNSKQSTWFVDGIQQLEE